MEAREPRRELGSKAEGEGAWLSLPGPCRAGLERRQCLEPSRLEVGRNLLRF